VSAELAHRLVAPNCIGLEPGQNIAKAEANGVLMLTLIGLSRLFAPAPAGGQTRAQLPPPDPLRGQSNEPFNDVNVRHVSLAAQEVAFGVQGSPTPASLITTATSFAVLVQVLLTMGGLFTQSIP